MTIVLIRPLNQQWLWQTVSHPSGSKNSKWKGTDKLDIVDYICIVKIVTLPEFLVSVEVRREPGDKELTTLFQIWLTRQGKNF